MTKKDLNWKPDTSLPTGKGATKQRFATRDDKEELSIETTPWGEGELDADGQVVARVDGQDDKDAGQAFRHLDRIAHEYEEARDAFDEVDKPKAPNKKAKK